MRTSGFAGVPAEGQARCGLQVDGLVVLLERNGSRRQLGPFQTAENAQLACSVLAAKAAGIDQGPASGSSFDELAEQLQQCADELATTNSAAAA
ncbi:hypothetical protein ABPG75_012093 [Micractinium tetrahymenae]